MVERERTTTKRRQSKISEEKQKRNVNWKEDIAFESKKKNHMSVGEKDGSLSWKTNVLFSSSIPGDKSPAPGLFQNGELHVSVKALQICILKK